MSGDFPLVWHWRKYLPDRKGQACRVVHGPGPGRGPRNVLVEFADGFRVVTSRWAVREKPVARQDGQGTLWT